MRYILLLLVFNFPLFVFGEESGGSKNIAEMHAVKWKYITDQTLMESKDAELVQPIFMAYEHDNWALHDQKRDFFKAGSAKGLKGEVNYAQLNDEYIEIETQELKLLKSYHGRLKKILKPQMLFNYYHAERGFKRHLLDDVRGGRHKNKQ